MRTPRQLLSRPAPPGGATTAEIETALYRIVQEALTNVVKHAHAEHVEIEIAEDDRLTVTVRDDGSGFDTGARNEGFGLVGMRERMALVGGEISIDSAPGEGTTVRATLPSRRREDSGEADDELRRPA